MNRRKKLIINIIILILLSLAILRYLELSFFPMKLFKLAESNAHYGPSKILLVEDNKSFKYFLGSWDGNSSSLVVLKKLGPVYRIYRQDRLHTNPSTKSFDLAHKLDSDYKNFYGYVYGNSLDPELEQLILEFKNGNKITIDKFYEGRFFTQWTNTIDVEFPIKSVSALDKKGNLIERLILEY